MEQISDIKKRMHSVREIRQTTNAMHLVSTVKMKRARSQLSMTLPFFDLCRATMAKIYTQNPDINHSFFKLHKKNKGEPWVVGYFVLTGDKGFAGAYNLNVLTTAETHIHELMIDFAKKGINAKPKIFIAGKKGKDYFKNAGFDIVEEFSYPIDSPTFYRARDISDFIHDLYDEQQIDTVYAIYTVMKSTINIKPVTLKLIPISAEDLMEGVHLEKYKQEITVLSNVNLEFIPTSEKVMDYLATTYLNGMIYGALTEAFASEQTTRMSAMKKATDSVEEIISDYVQESNRRRQDKITGEISEIVGGSGM